METFKEQDYTVNICTDIMEWGREFYDLDDLPEDAVLANREELESQCMGFANIEDKEIWVFVSNDFDEEELGETIAHEIGHIIETGFTEDGDPEEKAEFYESFYSTVRKVLKKSIEILN